MSACNTSYLDLFSLNDPTPFSKLGHMAAKIAYYNYEWRFNTCLVFNLIHLISLEAFLTSYNKAIGVKKGKFIHPSLLLSRPQVPQFVIFGDDADELIDLLQWLVDVKYDNTAKFIIVCSTYYHKCDESSLFESLIKIDVANVVFLKLSENNEPAAYTFFPLKPNAKCWNYDPEIIDITYGCPYDECYKNAFPEKFNNLYKCKLTISTFEQPPYMYLTNGTAGVEVSGRDGDIIKLVASLLNATLVIKTPLEGSDWGHYENNNWTGSLGDAFNGRTHGSMCATPLTHTKYGNFQISFTYDSMDMVWAAPMPALKPTWEKLLRPLPVYLRIILLLMFIGIVFMNTFTRTKVWKNVIRDMNITPWSSNMLVYSWILFLGMPVVKLPRRTSFRILVYSWIWYCSIIRCVYQASLMTSLKLRAYEDSLENFTEVLAKEYSFGGLPSLREYYLKDTFIYENWRPVGLVEAHDVLDKISTGEMEFVIGLNKETIVEHFLKYNGTRQIQILPQKIVNSPTVIYLKKNSHLTFPVSEILTIILEGGFSQRLYSTYVTYANVLLRPPKAHDAEPLRMVHFTGSFALLILGCILSTIFFAIEVVCGRNYC